jgi:hypothetical protein
VLILERFGTTLIRSGLCTLVVLSWAVVFVSGGDFASITAVLAALPIFGPALVFVSFIGLFAIERFLTGRFWQYCIFSQVVALLVFVESVFVGGPNADSTVKLKVELFSTLRF